MSSAPWDSARCLLALLPGKRAIGQITFERSTRRRRTHGHRARWAPFHRTAPGSVAKPCASSSWSEEAFVWDAADGMQSVHPALEHAGPVDDLRGVGRRDRRGGVVTLGR